MRAAVFLGAGRLEIQDVPDPAITRADQAIIRVEANGLCGSDVHALDVPPGRPFAPGVILGHEYSGVVSECGEQAGVAVGDRVAVMPNVPCGQCLQCRLGRPNLCANPGVFGSLRGPHDWPGGAAELAIAPASCLFRVPDDVPLDVAALAEPLACVVNACNRLSLSPGTSVLILGAGPIGLMAMLLALGAGANPVIVAETLPARAKVAKALGAHLVVDPNSENLADAVRDLSPGGADNVVDAVGSLLHVAVDAAAAGGRIVIVGVNEHVAPPVPAFAIVQKELTIAGSWVIRHTFPTALRLLAQPGLGLDRLITHRVPLEDTARAIDMLRSGEAVKALVMPGLRPDRA